MAVYRLLLRELFNALDEFVLLHAGVLATDDAALLLAGPPGVGKTTLVLALVEAGLRFFSDDFCPIERVSRLVHPFPRSAWVVGKPRAGEAAARVRKRPVSILGHGRTAEDRRPRPPGWVVLLDGGDATRHLCSLELAVAPGARPSLAREFAGLGAEVRVELPGKRRSRLRVAYPPGMGLATAVRRLLERRGGEIRDVYRDDAVRPDFDRTPVLHPVPRHETAFSLLADLKQSEWSRLGTRGAPGSPARLLMELADLLGDASCHRLRVGRLGETRDLLLRLVAGPAPARSRP